MPYSGNTGTLRSAPGRTNARRAIGEKGGDGKGSGGGEVGDTKPFRLPQKALVAGPQPGLTRQSS
jgi:hypothetical protein